MRQIFERIDVEIVGAAGQEAVERYPIVLVNNGTGVRRRQTVLPQDRYDGGSGEGAHPPAVLRGAGMDTTLSAIGAPVRYDAHMSSAFSRSLAKSYFW